jgi:hypothetical protein
VAMASPPTLSSTSSREAGRMSITEVYHAEWTRC